jgi:hypothetical protein
VRIRLGVERSQNPLERVRRLHGGTVALESRRQFASASAQRQPQRFMGNASASRFT